MRGAYTLMWVLLAAAVAYGLIAFGSLLIALLVFLGWVGGIVTDRLRNDYRKAHAA